MNGKKSIGFKPRKCKKENKQRSIEIKSKKEKKIHETIDKLILKAKQLKINISKPKNDVYKPIKNSRAFIDNFVEYKSNSKKDKSLSVTRYLNNIREHLRKLINDKRKKGKWQIQLIMKTNFISSENFNETRDMHSKSDNIEIMVGVDTNEIIKNLFNSLIQRYQKGLKESMRGSDFVFDYVESLNYIFHRVDLKRSGSYIETPDWIKKGNNKC